MRLTNLKITNFKAFQEAESFDLERLTLLTGANSSGKSSVMYSVLGSIQSGEFPFKFSPNGKYVNMGDFEEISYNHSINNEIKLDFKLNTSGEIYEVDTTWTNSKPSGLPTLKCLTFKTSYLKLTIDKNKKYSATIEYDREADSFGQKVMADDFKEVLRVFSKLGRTEEQIQKIEKEGLTDEFLKPIDESKDFINNLHSEEFETLDEVQSYLRKKGGLRLILVLDSITDLFNNFDKEVNYISSFRLHPERTYLESSKSNFRVEKFGEGYLDQIIFWQSHDTEKFKNLVTAIKKLGLFNDIETRRIKGGRYEMSIQVQKKGVWNSLSDVGFGISQFLPIIVADLQLKDNSTLFAAQPEIHLHPNVQAAFGNYLTEQIKTTEKNYVIETHSEYLLNRIRLQIVKGEIDSELVSVYFIDDKAPKVYKIQFTKDGKILNAPTNFFKTYMMDVMDIALNAE